MAGSISSSVKQLIDETVSSFDSQSATPAAGGDDVKRLMAVLLRARDAVVDFQTVTSGDDGAATVSEIQFLKDIKDLVHEVVHTLNQYKSLIARKTKRKEEEDDVSNSSVSCDFSDTVPRNKKNMRKEVAFSFSLGDTLDISDIDIDGPNCKRLRARIGVLESKIESFQLRGKQIGNESDVVYGREDDKAKLIQLLLSNDNDNDGGDRNNNSDNVSIVEITGTAGVGKTTLAQIVYDDPRVCEHFSLRAWVSVPKSFELISVIEEIARAVAVDHWYDREFISLLYALRTTIKDKMFLLVLDDFQNQDPTMWDSLFIPLVGGRKVKIIVTCGDQSLGVARAVWAVDVFRLSGLSAYGCWLLFRRHAFDAEDVVQNATLESMGLRIVKKSDGLPLSVKMLGSLLRYERDEQKWMNVLDSKLWGLDKTINAALRISYDHMPSHLKPCFAYCSVFPKGHKFKKDDLVRSWITHGLIQPCGSTTLEETATKYFDDLHRRSFFLRCVRVEGEPVDLFGMHDLVYELSQSVSGEQRGATVDVEEFTEKQVEYSLGLLKTGVDPPQTRSQSEIAVSLHQASLRVDEPTVYGRDDDSKRAMELLLSDECRGNDVSVIRIVAAAGVGKTTLAKLLYSNSTLCETFETRAWVHVNRRFDVRMLQKAIIESLTGIFCGLTELVEIQEAVREEIMGKRFFLVLDNVCNDDLSFWGSLLTPLSVGAKGSIIIATTRNEKADVFMNTVHSYKLSRLSEGNCWSIFLQAALYGRDDNVCLDFIGIGKQIVSRSEGLPLAVRALGGLLGSALYKSLWSTVLELNWSPWGVNENLPALKLCYDHLAIHLKHCFKYCSLFPKGYIFEKDHLLRLWISQGFIVHEEGERVEDSGNKYFDELLRRSFFQQSTIWGPKEKGYIMHDLFHDVAQSVSVNECFRAETCNLPSTSEKVLHVSIVADELETKVHFEPFKESGNIQTLLLICTSSLKPDTSVFHVESLEILNDLFLHFRFLRTLDLSFTNIAGLPDSIATLEHLCYLGLNKTNISKLPESICSLCNLQILELRDCSYLSVLPADIKYLAKLRHLEVSKESGFVFMPPGIAKLTGLQTLSTFTVGTDKQHCGIRELKDLMNLRGALCIGGLGNVANGEEAKEAKLELKEHLRTLTLQWLNCVEDLEGDQSVETASEVLQSLQSHSNIEELTLRDYSGDRLANWMADPLFSMLTSITLDNCYECNDLPPLGQLPSLKHLSIRMMDGVRRLGHQFCGSGISRGFPSLETMKLWDMYELEEWCGVESKEFPRLRKFSFSRCDKLKKLPCFTYLQELSIHFCAELPDLPTLPRLKSLKIDSLQNFVSFPKQLDLPMLKILEISNCDRLLSLDGLSNIASLEKLKITRCPKLNISLNELLPSMLQVVDIQCGCSLLSGWCPNGFEEICNANQVTRRLVNKQRGKKVL